MEGESLHILIKYTRKQIHFIILTKIACVDREASLAVSKFGTVSPTPVCPNNLLTLMIITIDSSWNTAHKSNIL